MGTVAAYLKFINRLKNSWDAVCHFLCCSKLTVWKKKKVLLWTSVTEMKTELQIASQLLSLCTSPAVAHTRLKNTLFSHQLSQNRNRYPAPLSYGVNTAFLHWISLCWCWNTSSYFFLSPSWLFLPVPVSQRREPYALVFKSVLKL